MQIGVTHAKLLSQKRRLRMKGREDHKRQIERESVALVAARTRRE